MKRALLVTCLLLLLSDAAAARTPELPNGAGSTDPAPREGVFALATTSTATPAGPDASETFSGSLFAGLQFDGGWHHAIEDGPRAVITRSGAGYTLLLAGRPLSGRYGRSFTAPVRQDPDNPLEGLATIRSQLGNVATLSLALNADGSVLTVAVKEMHDGQAEDVFRDFALGAFKPDWPGDAAPASYELWWSNLGRTRIGRPRPGMILVDQLGAAGSVDRRLVVETRATAADGATVWVGPWVASDGSSAGVGELRLSAAGNAFSGALTSASGTLAWEGSRDRPANSPAQEPERPAPPPPSAPVEAPRDLGPFRVSFGGLERPRGSAVVRAVVVIQNMTQQVQHLPSGTFRAILTDADGAGQERNQLWRGSGEPAQLFNGTPALQPGRELTVRFTFNPDIRQLDSLVLMRGSEEVEFDLAGQ